MYLFIAKKNPTMHFLLLFLIKIICCDVALNDEQVEKILDQYRLLTYDQWDSLDEDVKEKFNNFVEYEYQPFGILYKTISDISIEEINRIKTLYQEQLDENNKKIAEVNKYLDEAFVEEGLIEEKECELEKECLQDSLCTIDVIFSNLKTNRFYFKLLKNNIQLYHFNLFAFFAMNEYRFNKGTIDEYFFTFIKTQINVKSDLENYREAVKSFQAEVGGNFTNLRISYDKNINFLGTSEQQYNQEILSELKKLKTAINKAGQKNECHLYKLLQNDGFRSTVINLIIKRIKRRTFDNVALYGDITYDSLIFDLKRSRKLKDYLKHIIERKEDWFEYNCFYILNDDKSIKEVINKLN